MPIAAVEPDGLMVTSRREYVRLLRLPRVLQPLAGGRGHREQLRDRLAAIASGLPAGERLQVVVSAEPLDAERALARDWREITTSTRDCDASTQEAMRRLGYGLEQSVRASGPVVDAVEVDWLAAIAHRGAAIAHPRGGCAVIPRAVHEAAAADSWELADGMRGDLAAAGCEVEALDGGQALAELARAIDPSRRLDAVEFSGLPVVLDTIDPEAALAHRHGLIAAIGGGAQLRAGRDTFERADHDAPAREVEAVLHLSSPPGHTSPWWMLGLLEFPAPWRLAVHVTATDRVRQRRRYRRRRRRRRLWADLRRRERKGVLVDEDAYAQEEEAAEIAAELQSGGAAGLYEVSLYLSIRRPVEERDELARQLARLIREFESYTDAHLYDGRFLVEDSWLGTLPLAIDPLRASRHFSQRNIADCLPLLSTSASSRGGVPLGFATPGNTLERVDPFDPRYRTHVVLVTGASGSGKTVTVNAVLSRNVARGARGYIIDRSSSEDEGGSTRQAGHYEQFAQLVPGSRVLHYGASERDAVLNPWDVADVHAVSASKVGFLLALHTLLVGDPTSGVPALAGLERTLLTRGIQAVYARCAQTGEAPRERLLYEELRRLAREQVADQADGDLSVASELRRLAERLHPFIDDGPNAWMCDQPTTLESGAPLVLFDLAGLPDALAGPVILTLVDYIDRDVAQRRARFRSGHSNESGPWAGRSFLAIDEAWKPLLTPEAGSWLNEWARRTRHNACALFAITQHLADFANAQGRALLRNSVLRLMFHTAHDELDGVREALGYHDEDLDAVSGQETRKGEFATCYLDSEVHGRTAVRIYLSDIEYWACSADPDRDQPLRALAMAEADGDAWNAMRLLVDPAWHHARATELARVAEALEEAA
ncbi:hypothetical protein OM076_43300 [Solirubrobacter ginsenosidimutans]|uniref:Uncharacterized protein n=1 Tax=Solirubrobacter ginsenosidimutans TaxID=490573 RepID=A0A9X3N1Z8_9ACTN|nr:hypothetical protein [Solirubrobacter ginsenosidimutans]MDA0167166.1 hypothetical protein [Solirubrobacter ginsenosidimutans]